MTAARQPLHLTEPAGGAPVPADVPGDRPAVLDRLEPLVGEWTVEAVFPFAPAATVPGRIAFAWLDGGFFLVQRWTVGHPEAPDGIALIGLADAAGGPSGAGGTTFVQHYYDSRGVRREYGLDVVDGVWSMQRTAPGFSQRFSARFAADRGAIEGAWEKSSDGVTWEHDFAQTYRRVV